MKLVSVLFPSGIGIWFSIWIVAVTSSLGRSWIAEAASAGPAQFVILHTNNVNGHLFGCPT